MARIVIPTLLARMVDTDNISQTQIYLACIKARSTLYALRVPQESDHTACPAAYILHTRIKFICTCWLAMRVLTLVGDLRPCHACIAAPNSVLLALLTRDLTRVITGVCDGVICRDIRRSASFV